MLQNCHKRPDSSALGLRWVEPAGPGHSGLAGSRPLEAKLSKDKWLNLYHFLPEARLHQHHGWLHSTAFAELAGSGPAIQRQAKNVLRRWVVHAIFQIALLFFFRGQAAEGVFGEHGADE